MSNALHGFTEQTLTLDGVTRTVFSQGEGPAIVVIAEVPGITPEVAGFAQRLVDRGFSTYLPVLFGTPGKPKGAGNVLSTLVHACISREFHLLARGSDSPVTAWLRALARHAHAQHGGPGVGAIGMCLTGNFALSMVLEPCVVAPVLSQPSLPFAISPAHAADPGASPAAITTMRARHEADGMKLLGLRFSHDLTCPAARFTRLGELLGDAFEPHVIDSGPGNPSGHSRMAHSVVTNDLIDKEGEPTRAALHRVLAYFDERLGG